MNDGSESAGFSGLFRQVDLGLRRELDGAGELGQRELLVQVGVERRADELDADVDGVHGLPCGRRRSVPLARSVEPHIDGLRVAAHLGLVVEERELD